MNPLILLAALLLPAPSQTVVRIEYATFPIEGAGGTMLEYGTLLDVTYHGVPVTAYVLSGDFFGLAGDVVVIPSAGLLPLPLSVLDKLDNAADVKLTTMVCIPVVDQGPTKIFLLGNGTLSEAAAEVQAYVNTIVLLPTKACN